MLNLTVTGRMVSGRVCFLFCFFEGGGKEMGESEVECGRVERGGKRGGRERGR